MGIVPNVIAALTAICNPKLLLHHTAHIIIECDSKLYLHLVELNTSLHPQALIHLQEKYKQEGKLLFHLWEDVWLFNQAGVLSRIKSFLGLNQTFHARKAKIIEVEAVAAVKFFNTYHLQGAVRAKNHYGLTIDGELISLASFSALRPMKFKGDQYTSAELIRFASKDSLTVTGGLSKLIKHFLIQKKPNDLMTYADRDWSLGKGYHQLGFELTAFTPPAYLFLDKNSGVRYFSHRLPKMVLSEFDAQKELNLEEYLIQHGFIKVFNTGNLKYHLYI